MLCRFCFSHRNFGCFDLVCSIVPSTFVIFPIGITVIFNIICLWMGKIYAATPGQNSGVARISILFYYIILYLYIYIIYLSPTQTFQCFYSPIGHSNLPLPGHLGQGILKLHRSQRVQAFAWHDFTHFTGKKHGKIGPNHGKTWLVGGWALPLWKIWVRQWEGWHPIYEMENKKWLKPPTRK